MQPTTTATAAAIPPSVSLMAGNALKHLESRKLLLIRQIAELEDETVLTSLEALLLSVVFEEEGIANEEQALIAERLAAWRANPDDVIAWDTLKMEFLRKK